MSAADLRRLAAALAPLDAPLPKPGPSDWLTSHPEGGQTLDRFLADRPAPQVDWYNTLYVQPVGTFTADQQKLIADTASFLGAFYNVRVKTLDALPLSVIPAGGRRVHPTWNIPQIKTAYVEGLLRKSRPRDAIAVIALTTSDLYPDEDWNFVFGEADLNDRVGVWSLYRYGDPATAYPAVLLRTLKVAAHETGHMLGLYHCTAHHCGMNGSNHLDETDRSPLWFCSACDAKITFTTKADAAARYATLAAWAAAHGIKPEAAHWEKCAAAVR